MNTSTQPIDRDELIEKLNECYDTRDEELELLISTDEDTESLEDIAMGLTRVSRL